MESSCHVLTRPGYEAQLAVSQGNSANTIASTSRISDNVQRSNRKYTRHGEKMKYEDRNERNKKHQETYFEVAAYTWRVYWKGCLHMRFATFARLRALDKLLGKCAFCIAKVGVLIESSASQNMVLRCSVKTQVWSSFKVTIGRSLHDSSDIVKQSFPRMVH